MIVCCVTSFIVFLSEFQGAKLPFFSILVFFSFSLSPSAEFQHFPAKSHYVHTVGRPKPPSPFTTREREARCESSRCVKGYTDNLRHSTFQPLYLDGKAGEGVCLADNFKRHFNMSAPHFVTFLKRDNFLP